MANQIINVGTAPNSSDGDALRNAFIKINGNFAELYQFNRAASELIRNTSAALLTNGVHVGITAAYDSVNQRVNLTGFNGDYNMLINKPFANTEAGSSASVYTPGDINFDGANSSAVYDPTTYNLEGGGA